MVARVFLVSGLILAPVSASEEIRFEATLAGHACLGGADPDRTLGDAPREARISGKFTGPTRIGRPMGVRKATGIARPFVGQPLQGFSGFAMATGPEGGTVTLSDSGFVNHANCSDALLDFSRVRPDWESGARHGRDRQQPAFLDGTRAGAGGGQRVRAAARPGNCSPPSGGAGGRQSTGPNIATVLLASLLGRLQSRTSSSVT